MKISFFLPTLKFGGIEANTIRLAKSFVDSGHQIDLIVGTAKGEYIKRLDPRINLINFNKPKLIGMLNPLVNYLKQEKPDILYTGGEGANIVVTSAKLFVPYVKVIISIRTQLSVEYAETRSKLKKILFPYLSKFLYKKADGIVAVSDGVAKDASKLLNIPYEKMDIIYNPIIDEQIHSLMDEQCQHHWIKNDDLKVILWVGRLVKQKDLISLVSAFKLVNEKKPDTRLLLIGEGPLKEETLNLIKELDLENKIELVGFVQNPYKYMKNADLFVLSSQWEGFGNVIVEALITGTPVVSTNCPSGPDEILRHGKYGRLAEVKNVLDLARKIEEELHTNTSTVEKRISRANEFTVEIAKSKYIDLMKRI